MGSKAVNSSWDRHGIEILVVVGVVAVIRRTSIDIGEVARDYYAGCRTDTCAWRILRDICVQLLFFSPGVGFLNSREISSLHKQEANILHL